MSFSELSLSPVLLQSIRERGHRQPTAIQSGAIPLALAGRDLIAIAETGSGKTVAFLLPVLDRLHSNRPDGIGALVLAPTRELASQIGHEFDLLARNTGLRAAAMWGENRSVGKCAQSVPASSSRSHALEDSSIISNAAR